MRKVAFLFPGQGAQYMGMGRELYESYDVVKQVFDRANDILGQDLKTLCFDGPEDELKKTENTQPAILTLSIAVMELLKDCGIIPHVVAGLSLGEYSALVAAGAISFDDALPLVRKRGGFMQEAVPLGQGTMAAIIGLESAIVHKCCQDAAPSGVVEIANYNCPGQLVISGTVAAVEHACKLAKESGAKRALMLSVSGPFHSSLLHPAGLKLKEELSKITVFDPQIPVISNVQALPAPDKGAIKELLVEQVSNSVKWEASMDWILGQGIDTLIEVGPGKVLSGFMRKINKDAIAFNVEDIASLEKTLKGLEEMA